MKRIYWCLRQKQNWFVNYGNWTGGGNVTHFHSVTQTEKLMTGGICESGYDLSTHFHLCALCTYWQPFEGATRLCMTREWHGNKRHPSISTRKVYSVFMGFALMWLRPTPTFGKHTRIYHRTRSKPDAGCHKDSCLGRFFSVGEVWHTFEWNPGWFIIQDQYKWPGWRQKMCCFWSWLWFKLCLMTHPSIFCSPLLILIPVVSGREAGIHPALGTSPLDTHTHTQSPQTW